MKLQIKKLFLVRRETHEFKTYDFETNKLNVIVGQSAARRLYGRLLTMFAVQGNVT